MGDQYANPTGAGLRIDHLLETAESSADTDVREQLSGLAYSAEEPGTIKEVAPQQHSWRRTALVAFALVAFAASAVGVAVVAWHGSDPLRDTTTASAPAPTVALPAPQPVTLPDVPDAAPEDQTARFIALVERGGFLAVSPAGVQTEVGNAQTICNGRRMGYTEAYMVSDVMSRAHMDNGGSPSEPAAHALVTASEEVYCPQYTR
jgi:hypothetical protein